MSSRSERGRALPFALAALLLALGAGAAAAAWHPGANASGERGGAAPGPSAATSDGSTAALRVCADPNNLPFSDRAGKGFENRIAELVAHDLHRPLEYTWWPQRRGFARHTLDAGACDVVIGLPVGYPFALETRPYYRSTYVFVTRRGRVRALHSLNDPRLHHLRIGLHFTGGRANPPAAHALARRGIVRNVVPYSIYGNYTDPNPPARLIDAVARGDVDVAIAWGPLAGYFARRESVPLVITPVSPSVDGPGTAFVFPIAMGVRRGNVALRDTLQHELDRRGAEIDRILNAYGIPRVGAPAAETAVAAASAGEPGRK